MELLGPLCISLGAASLTYSAGGLRPVFDAGRVARRLADHGLAPRGPRGLVAALGQLLIGGAKDRQEIEASLRSAGFESPYAPLIFAWARLLIAGGAGFACMIFLMITHRWHGWGPFITWVVAG